MIIGLNYELYGVWENPIYGREGEGEEVERKGKRERETME